MLASLILAVGRVTNLSQGASHHALKAVILSNHQSAASQEIEARTGGKIRLAR
ncbi:MAG: hypothetical protein AB1861_24275 [Cyanobacteriota bacterium]